MLADKVIGNMVGIWLLVPEHLRLGTWDLLGGWTGAAGGALPRRLAMQAIHESALCLTGLRDQRCLNHKGFELANGLPFVASDVAIHRLLDEHTVRGAQRLQVALGRIRHTLGHFRGQLLAIDPHRLRSYSKRHMRQRKANSCAPSVKMAQTFFCLDADTRQPVCMILATAAQTVAAATPPLLEMAADILNPPNAPLVLADCEHFTVDLLQQVRRAGRFDLLAPMPRQPYFRRRLQAIPPEQFTARWAGYSTAKIPYDLLGDGSPPLTLMVQRFGEKADRFTWNSFVCTADRPEVACLTQDFPRRWHIEEFFNSHQAMGWQRAGTQNLHIRYGRMSLAMIAQAATCQLRQHLDETTAAWDAKHLAADLLAGMEGDVRVSDDTIVVTYYNAPLSDKLRARYEGTPDRLEAEGIDPHIPWLYNLKLDFRFR
jgi:hypothetical protein